MRTSTLLSLSLLATSSIVTLAGCAGGGGGGATPCCEATGQATGPTSFAPGELMAQPIAFLGTTSCLSLTLPLALPEYDELGRAVAVDPTTNRYTVSIGAEGVGREVAIRIFDTDLDGTERNLAVVGLAEPAAEAATPITAAPVFLNALVIDEFSLEEAVLCRLRNGSLNEALGPNMRRNDVRAAISSDVYESFIGAEGINGIVLAIRNYRHALNGLGNAMESDAERDAHALARAAIERAADEHRDQNSAADPSIEARRAALERFRRIAAIPASFTDTEPLHRHLQSWAQDWNEEIDLGGFTLDTSNASVRAQYLENHLLRFAIAEARINEAVDAPSAMFVLDRTFTSGGAVPSIDTILANMEEQLVNPGVGLLPAPNNIADALRTAWTSFGNNLAQNIGAQVPAISTQLPTTKSDVDGNGIAVQNALNRTQTAEEMIDALYEGVAGPGVWRATKDQIDLDYSGSIPSDTDRARLTDLLFYPAVNVPPY